MATLAAKHLISSNVNVVILNRNIKRAEWAILKKYLTSALTFQKPITHKNESV